MSTRNIALSVIAAIILAWVLFTGLAHAWMALGVLKFIFIIIAFVGVGWFWGRFTK